jgi:hypothetical protein
MGDDLETEAAEAPPPPGPNRVEITVGGHAIVVESPDPLADVVGYALSLFEQTAEPAKKLPFGFDVTGGQFERAAPYVEPSGMQSWGDDRAGRMGRQPAQERTTRRLGVPDPPGHHRARLGSVQVDRARAPLSGPRH